MLETLTVVRYNEGSGVEMKFHNPGLPGLISLDTQTVLEVTDEQKMVKFIPQPTNEDSYQIKPANQ